MALQSGIRHSIGFVAIMACMQTPGIYSNDGAADMKSSDTNAMTIFC